MAKVDGVLFIDANQYLDLYRLVSGKKVLAPLRGFQKYIFVTAQIVDEVHRKKVEVAASFLKAEFKKLELSNFSIPDHLFATTGQGMQEQLDEIRSKIEAVSRELKKQAHELLGQISRSEDEVSKALSGIFAKAVPHSENELLRARERKELGHAPGKQADPLGDQLSWEQVLGKCEDKSRLWIITRDGDYATKYDGKHFLNAALYEDLARVKARLGQPAPEVFCFGDILTGIGDFAKVNNVEAEKLPTPRETEEIRREQEALPPIVDWLTPWNTSITIRPPAGIVGLGGGQVIIEPPVV